jgi:CheY-like chemotaxis protein
VAKILVADDNSNIQKMVGLALKDQGIDVVAVGNGEAAVRKISDLKPDLVLADVFMPVRNGYEVCKYVKDDPALKHIPVILLVGAFDPLDEQEAQRVGADGVLKKPFVPPDPLISMVKSALARAGVPLGNTPAAEKAPDLAKRDAAELLSPAASKLAALTAATKLPEPEVEPFVENFATLPEQVKIPEGNEPLAFGSLLETPELEDDAAFLPSRPPTELSSGSHEWGKEASEEEEVEEEEESSGSGWRPGGDLDAPSLPAIDEAGVENQVADWRQAAFHGSSPSKPSKSRGWAPAIDEPVHAEAASSQSSVGVTTLEAVKPVEAPAFSGDAWAAAMAAGVEEKTAEAQEEIAEAAEPAASVATQEIGEPIAVGETAAGHSPAHETPKAPTPDNGWYSVSASPWEMEAKKATLLAATWDSAVAEEPAKESVEEPFASDVVDTVAPQIQEEIREVVQQVVQQVVAEPEPLAEQPSAYAQIEEVAKVEEEVAAAPTEDHLAAPAGYVGKNVNDTQEIDTFQPADSKSWENKWAAVPVEVVNQFVEAPRQEFAEAEHAEAPTAAAEVNQDLSQGTSHAHAENVVEPATEQVAHEHAAETAPEPARAGEPTANMDELVARVLARMNPDMLQKMTQDLLRPVIEAIVQDELKSKKQ